MSGWAVFTLALIARFRRKYGLNEEIYRQDGKRKRKHKGKKRKPKCERCGEPIKHCDCAAWDALWEHYAILG